MPNVRDLKFSGEALSPWDSKQFQGDLVFVEGGEEVSQNSKIRLLVLFGEQFDDTRVGTPWLSDLTSTLVSIDAKRAILRKIIADTYGAKSIDSLEVFVEDERVAILNWEGTTEDGNFFKGEIDNA
jgi:hypothetical protein